MFSLNIIYKFIDEQKKFIGYVLWHFILPLAEDYNITTIHFFENNSIVYVFVFNDSLLKFYNLAVKFDNSLEIEKVYAESVLFDSRIKRTNLAEYEKIEFLEDTKYSYSFSSDEDEIIACISSTKLCIVGNWLVLIINSNVFWNKEETEIKVGPHGLELSCGESEIDAYNFKMFYSKNGVSGFVVLRDTSAVLKAIYWTGKLVLVAANLTTLSILSFGAEVVEEKLFNNILLRQLPGPFKGGNTVANFYDIVENKVFASFIDASSIEQLVQLN